MKVTPHLRAMTLADIAQVYVLELACHPFPWTEGILKDCLRVGYESWVLEANAQIVGFGIISVAAQECHILNLCVLPTEQRQGFGSKLLQHLLRQAKQQAAEVAILEVRRSNQAALNLYEKFGFNEIGVRKGYYSGKRGHEDAIVLGLDLRVRDFL